MLKFFIILSSVMMIVASVAMGVSTIYKIKEIVKIVKSRKK